LHTLSDIATVLRSRLKQNRLNQEALRSSAGISKRTLTNVLSGEHDFKVTTLFAIADRLGLELLLVPKGAASGLTSGDPPSPLVKTRVQAALERVDPTQNSDER